MRPAAAMEEVAIDITDYTGAIGVYQITLFLILASMMFLGGGVDSISMNFLGGFQDHWCKIEELQNFSHAQQRYIAIPLDGDDYASCFSFPLNWTEYSRDELESWNRTARTEGIPPQEYVACDVGWVFDQSQYISTLGSELGLVCDERWLVEMVSSIYMAGRLVGAITCGFVSDRFGRKQGMMLFHVLRLFACVTCLYSPAYPAFAVGRFFMAIGSTGSTLCAYVLLTEFLDNKYRAVLGTWWHIVFSFGYMSVCVMAYLVRDYQYYQMTLYWPHLVFLFFYVCAPESPRWLISRGRTEEALKIIQFACKVNKLPVPDKINLQPSPQATQNNTNNGTVNTIHTEKMEKTWTSERKEKGPIDVVVEDEPQKQPGFLDLFKTPNLRKTTLIVWFSWFSTSLVYYGLSLNAGRLAGDVYLNSFIMGAVEIPANLIAMWVIKHVGRKWCVAGASLLAGGASFVNIPLLLDGGYNTAVTAMAVIGKAGTQAGFAGVYLYAVEIFPTPIRNVGIGSSSMLARVGGILAPFAGGPLEDVWKPLPPLLFGVTATLSGLLFFLLPETRGRKLPETIEEAESFGRVQSSDAAPSPETMMTAL